MMNQEKRVSIPFYTWQSMPKTCLFLVGKPNEESRKNSFFFQSIITLVPKGFHKTCGALISGTLFNVKSKNWFTNFLKSPFFANVHDLVFTNAKF